MKNQLSVQKTVHLLHPYVAKSDGIKESPVLDCFGFDSANIHIHVGETGEALSEDLSLTLHLACCDEPKGTYTAVEDEEITLDSPDDAKNVWSLSYHGRARYLKLILTFEGEHARGTMLSAVAILSLPHVAPLH